MAVIYAFGDSITYGAWDIEGGGWVSRLRTYLDDLQNKNPDLYYLVYNLGIPGESTEGLIERFDSDMLARNQKDEEKIILFAYGANDAAIIKETDQFKEPIEDFERNLAEAIQKAAKLSSKIVMLTITPIDEEVVAKQKYNFTKTRLNSYVNSYNSTLQILARDKKIVLIDVYSEFMKNDHRSLFCKDGLHPNEKGHELIFELVKKTIENIA